MVAAKTAVFAGLLVVVSLVAVFAAFLVGTLVLSARGQATAPFFDAHTIGSLLGMAGYLSAIGLIGLGVGILLRNVAGAVLLVVAGILVVPNLAQGLLPDSWDAVLQFLPNSAASAFTTVHAASADVLPGPVAVVVLVAWVVVVVGASAVLVQRRDV
ncbi:hypothetical protein ET495_13160 [Xylanimonas allomyrinae]|uniref:ABC transporter permease n=1 Tax=Xylanimonas allomyrinae TaxID=2509459 RepID=A0A4P6EMW8_9MICO|nr:hypothetical protein [Xylanimonas allomyrinae]QAY64014.1 hypothetical protein ET495_13160 [Xylanimonas allomyrinae]